MTRGAAVNRDRRSEIGDLGGYSMGSSVEVACRSALVRSLYLKEWFLLEEEHHAALLSYQLSASYMNFREAFFAFFAFFWNYKLILLH